MKRGRGGWSEGGGVTSHAASSPSQREEILSVPFRHVD
ncbi:hypothetical protein Taro_056326, partial [Colocasia esculenta]|nr:hypothetical protein [Colocasia esculenta]